MENRPKFVKSMLDLLENWSSDPQIRDRIVNERVRFVYATAWSAFISVSRMFQGVGAEERANMESAFKEELLKHGEQALQDVYSETFVTRFWVDVLSGLQRSKIKKHFFDIRYVVRNDDGSLKEVTEGDEGAEKVCYIAQKSVFDEYAQDCRMRGEPPPLNLGDLKREMSKEPYWVQAPLKEPRTHRAYINGSRQGCWVITLDKFPFGEDLEQILEPNQPEKQEQGDVEEVNKTVARESARNAQ